MTTGDAGKQAKDLTVSLAVRVNGVQQAVTELALLQGMEKLGARNRQLAADVARLTRKLQEVDSTRISGLQEQITELAIQNANWRRTCNEQVSEIARLQGLLRQMRETENNRLSSEYGSGWFGRNLDG